jgi:hypothetical protein
VVVDFGDTAKLPPEAGTLYMEPSEPATFTEVALEAVTVKVSEDPAVMLLELARMVTVGFVVEEPTVTVAWDVALPLELVAVAV